LGITAGSSIFNLLVIPALVILFVLVKSPSKTMEITRKVLQRDGIMLILTIFVLIIVIDQAVLRWIHGFILVLAYFIYLGYMFFSMHQLRDEPGLPAVTERVLSSESTFVKILKLRLECLIVGKRELNRINAWALLIVSTLIMSFGTWLLVLGTEHLSESLNIHLLFIAVILSAAASSVPDTVISVKDARKGNYDDAISNALGSNIFDISFALGLPLLLYTLVYGKIEMDQSIIELSTELWMFLLITTILGFIIFISGRKLTRTKAWLFLAIYLVFVLYVIGQVLHSGITTTASQYMFEVVEKLKSLKIF
jgi:cation:H+ antiporter